MAPNDSSKGIADALREFVGASEKALITMERLFCLTDILDEYGKGRNDTKIFALCPRL